MYLLQGGQNQLSILTWFCPVIVESLDIVDILWLTDNSTSTRFHCTYKALNHLNLIDIRT